MKNFRFFVVVIVSIIAGYFAYPYFNPPKIETVDAPVKEKSRSFESTPVTTSSETESIPTQEKDNPIPVSATEEGPVAEDEIPAEESSQRAHESENSKKKSSRSGYGNSKTFSGQKITISNRDFSTYKLKNSEFRLALSDSDPRLVLIQGMYTGLAEGDSYELEIGPRESILRINEFVTVTKSNEFFFSNVNDNGNTLQIETGKNKTYIDLKNWPVLILSVGPLTNIQLRKQF